MEEGGVGGVCGVCRVVLASLLEPLVGDGGVPNVLPAASTIAPPSLLLSSALAGEGGVTGVHGVP